MSRLVGHEQFSLVKAPTLRKHSLTGEPGGGIGNGQVSSTSVFLPAASSDAYLALSLPLPFPDRLRDGALLRNLHPRKRGEILSWKGQTGMVATVLRPAKENKLNIPYHSKLKTSNMKASW